MQAFFLGKCQTKYNGVKYVFLCSNTSTPLRLVVQIYFASDRELPYTNIVVLAIYLFFKINRFVIVNMFSMFIVMFGHICFHVVSGLVDRSPVCPVT